jgi:hypothetical protein
MSDSDSRACFPEILATIDRELAFFRKRAGQVFFIGLSLEVVIAAGQHRIQLPPQPEWLTPAVVSLLFIAVAAAGIILGSEYRRRIRFLKRKRETLVIESILSNPFPPVDIQVVSEIHVLYLVLAFTSTTGALSAWVYAFPQSTTLRWILIVVSSGFIVYALTRASFCLKKQDYGPNT